MTPPSLVMQSNYAPETPNVIRAEALTWGLGDRFDRAYRSKIFKKYPYALANAMARTYFEKWHESGRREANLSLLPYASTDNRCQQELVNIATSEERISLVAERNARSCQRIKQFNLCEKSRYHKQAAIVRTAGLQPPTVGRLVTHRSASRRMTSKQWWRRQLRKMSAREYEAMAISFALVQKARSIYVSNQIFECIRQRERLNYESLSKLEAENELGDIRDLIDLVEHSLANPAIRRGELMARIAGFDKVAIEYGHAALFLTITCPSKYHAVSSTSGEQNPNYEGFTPRDAQLYLENMWKCVRAKLGREGIEIYGFRIVEPHHDGTPHWHMLLFIDQCNVNELLSIYRHYALLEDPNEPGAQEHRFKAVPIDRSKGNAAAYVAKYVSKSIDGYGVGDDSNSIDAKQSASRIVAWARNWGIRQFQQLGGPPVGIWRELRKISERPNGILGAAFDAANSGDWAAFVKIMGGPFVKRRDLPIQLSKLSTTDQLTGEVRLNRYGEQAPDQVYGVGADRVTICTRPHEWHIQAKSKDKAEAPDMNSEILKISVNVDYATLEFCQ